MHKCRNKTTVGAINYAVPFRQMVSRGGQVISLRHKTNASTWQHDHYNSNE